MHAVLNWLWQGCAVAAVMFAMLFLLERARANVRYIVCWAAQIFVLSLPLVAMLESGGGAAGRLPRVPVEAVVAMPDTWWTSGFVIAAAWLGWAGIGAIRFVRAILALRRARASSRPFPPQAESPLTHWRQVRDRARRPRLVVSDAVTAAAVLGCGTPMIAVAPALASRLEADELDRVLVHEWAHVQRRDDLVNLLQIAIRIVAGWHPAVWWIDRRMQAEREIACDETTVAITGAPKSYAACLVKLAGLKSGTAVPLAAPGVLAARGLRARITRIVSHGSFLAPRWSFCSAAAIAGVLAVVSVGVGQTKLVEASAFQIPYDAIRTAGARLDSLGPIAVPLALSGQAIAITSPLRTAIAARPESPSVHVAQAPSRGGTREAEAPAPPPDPPAPSIGPEFSQPTAADEAPVAAPPPQAAAAPVERERSPWTETADGGKAIGRVSKEAGLATAGFFSKFGRRVAGSF